MKRLLPFITGAIGLLLGWVLAGTQPIVPVEPKADVPSLQLNHAAIGAESSHVVAESDSSGLREPLQIGKCEQLESQVNELLARNGELSEDIAKLKAEIIVLRRAAEFGSDPSSFILKWRLISARPDLSDVEKEICLQYPWIGKALDQIVLGEEREKVSDAQILAFAKETAVFEKGFADLRADLKKNFPEFDPVTGLRKDSEGKFVISQPLSIASPEQRNFISYKYQRSREIRWNYVAAIFRTVSADAARRYYEDNSLANSFNTTDLSELEWSQAKLRLQRGEGPPPPPQF